MTHLLVTMNPMAHNTCTIEGCDKRRFGHGYCNMHYARWRKYGDTSVVNHGKRGKAAPLLDRFNAKWTADADGCWIWNGRLSDDGYGVLDLSWRGGGPKSCYAHRAAYELLVGPIPDGLELDHLCFVRSCVNPAHLEAVTHVENLRRAVERRYPKSLL